MNEKMKLNSLLPEACLVCEAPFDKTDKKMIDEWYMVVRREPQTVNLYCPACWTEARDSISQP